ncbi:MAG: hypothetical protein ACP5T2_03855 [Thermoprotei archaeon]
MDKELRSKLVARTGILIALSVMADLFPLPRAFFGMKVDLVGTIWVAAFLLYGIETATYTSLGTFLLMLAYSPTGFVGATMKLTATAPMFFMPWAVEKISGGKASSLFGPKLYALGSASGIIVRIFLAFLLNYYWAIPVFLGMPISQVVEKFFGGSLLALFLYVAALNLVQGILDATLPWILVVKFQLKKISGLI